MAMFGCMFFIFSIIFVIGLTVLFLDFEQLTYSGILNFPTTSVKILFNVSAASLSLATRKFSTTNVDYFLTYSIVSVSLLTYISHI